MEKKLFFERTKLLSSSHRGHKWQQWDFQTIRGTPLTLALIPKACMGPEMICVDSQGRGGEIHITRLGPIPVAYFHVRVCSCSELKEGGCNLRCARLLAMKCIFII